MNVAGMIVAELKRKRAKAMSEVGRLDSLITEFGGDVSSLPTGKPRAKHPRSKAQRDAIKKAQEARKAKAAAKGLQAVAGKGAPLAAAAGE